MFRSLLLTLILVILASSLSPAQSLFNDVNYKGARTHMFDVLHVAIDIEIQDASKSIVGSVRHTIRSLSPELRAIRLDAGPDITLNGIKVDGTPSQYRRAGDTLEIFLPRAINYNDTFTVAIDYQAKPKKGMYFIQPDANAPNRRNQVWTQGEGQDNHYWVPIYDYPNDRATSDVRVTARKDWKVLSNGELISTVGNSNRTNTWLWKMNKPHASYLIMIAAGDYTVLRDTVEGVPMEYWVYPDQVDRAEATFGRSKEVIRFFNKMIGIPYPWHKYAQVMIAEFMYGGMENTSATTLNDAYMVDARGFLDFNPDGVISHEAGHQWYGDLITNRSWGHLWLHESYATYLEARFMRHYYGEEQYVKEMYDNGMAAVYTDKYSGRDPIVLGNGVTANIYSRGGRVLHMLNALVGEDQFWRANRLFLQRCGYGVAETNDLKLAFEDATGQNLDWFFNEWLYKAGLPEYKVSYTTKKDSLMLRVQQMQKRDSLTGLFTMPIPVELALKSRTLTDTLWVMKEDQSFTLYCPEKPRYVIFDAGDVVMKTVDFPRSDEELIAQLSAPRMIDRLLAVKGLMGQKDTANLVAKAKRSLALRNAYMDERSKFVREEIVRNTDNMDSTNAQDIIAKAVSDTEVNVRRAGVEAISMVRDTKRRAELLRPLTNDSSYSIVSMSITNLAEIDPKGLEPILKSIKSIRGRRDGLALAWLRAVKAGRYNGLVDDVVDFTMGTYSEGTRGQAYTVLSKLDTATDASRNSIIRGLQDNSTSIVSAATTAARLRLDDKLRSMLEALRGKVSAEKKDIIDGILKK